MDKTLDTKRLKRHVFSDDISSKDIKVQLRFPLISTRHRYAGQWLRTKPGHPFIFHEEHVHNSTLARLGVEDF